MKTLRISLLTSLLFLVSMLFPVYGAEVNGIYYSITSSTDLTVAVTYRNRDYNSYSGVVSIPETVTILGKTYRVTSIGQLAFYKCSELTEVSIPSSIVSIDGWAFSECPELTTINISNGVKYIGQSAFYQCSKLSKLSIPNSVTLIEDGAFASCSNLTSIVIPNSVTKIGGGILDNCLRLDSLSLPFVGDTIDAPKFPFGHLFNGNPEENCIAAFQYYSNGLNGSKTYYIPASLKTVTITGCNKIPYRSFINCKGIESIILGEGIEIIEDEAFYFCSGLKSLSIPNTMKSIGNKSFWACTSLDSHPS